MLPLFLEDNYILIQQSGSYRGDNLFGQFYIAPIAYKNIDLVPDKGKILGIVIDCSLKNKGITQFYYTTTVIIARDP